MNKDDPNKPKPEPETGNWAKKDGFDKAFDFVLGFLAGGFSGLYCFLRRAPSFKIALLIALGMGLFGGLLVMRYRPKFSNLHEGGEDFWDRFFRIFWP